MLPETSHLHEAPSGSHDLLSVPESLGVATTGRVVGIGVTRELLVLPGLSDGSAALFSAFCVWFKKMNKNALTTAKRMTPTIM